MIHRCRVKGNTQSELVDSTSTSPLYRETELSKPIERITFDPYTRKVVLKLVKLMGKEFDNSDRNGQLLSNSFLGVL